MSCVELRCVALCCVACDCAAVSLPQGGKKNPQKDFAGCVAEAASRPGVAPAVAAHLTSIAAYDNVPRKKKQFINFCQNSLKLRQPAGESAACLRACAVRH